MVSISLPVFETRPVSRFRVCRCEGGAWVCPKTLAARPSDATSVKA